MSGALTDLVSLHTVSQKHLKYICLQHRQNTRRKWT